MGRSRYRVTETRISKLHKQGRGTGHGRDYVPWINVQDISSVGRVHRIVGGKTGRIHHLLSDRELDVFLMLDWSVRVRDIREQFPLPRPETIIIAESMGVPHPRANGIDIVMTTDFLIDLVDGTNVAITFKQADELKKRRVREKLEIERRYWTSKQVEYLILDETHLAGDRGSHPEVIVSRRHNLLQLAEWRCFDDMDVPYPRYWADRAEALLLAFAVADQPILGDFLSAVERTSLWSPGEATCALKHLLAKRVLAMDLNRALALDGPLTQVWIADCQLNAAREQPACS